MFIVPDYTIIFLYLISIFKKILWNNRYIILIILSVYLFFYFDKTENTGERKLNILNKLLDPFYDFFNISFTNEKYLKSNKKYILAVHPHGIIPFGSRIGTKDYDLFYATFPLIFKIPIIRDIFLAFGTVDCRKEVLNNLLKDNKKICIFPGGSREIQYSNRYKLDLVLKNEGFIKLAWENKCPLIPVFTEGENQLFQQFKIKSLQNFFYNLIRYPFPIIFYGPLTNNITLHVGKPLNPNKFKSYENFRKEYWKRLFILINKYEKGEITGELLKKMKEYGFRK